MKELYALKKHKRSISGFKFLELDNCTPLVSFGQDGNICFWTWEKGELKYTSEKAHELMIWDVAICKNANKT